MALSEVLFAGCIERFYDIEGMRMCYVMQPNQILLLKRIALKINCNRIVNSYKTISLYAITKKCIRTTYYENKI